MTGSKKQRIAGWILTILIAIFLAGVSASGKFTEWEGKEQMFENFGFSVPLMFKIGILEVIIAILIVIPQTGFIGTILLTGYLGGAVVTHVRIGDGFIMPVAIGVLAWVALALRRPVIWSLAVGRG